MSNPLVQLDPTQLYRLNWNYVMGWIGLGWIFFIYHDGLGQKFPLIQSDLIHAYPHTHCHVSMTMYASVILYSNSRLPIALCHVRRDGMDCTWLISSHILFLLGFFQYSISVKSTMSSQISCLFSSNTVLLSWVRGKLWYS